MAETFTIRNSVDAWVSETRDGRFGDQRLYVHSTANAYMYFSRPILPDGSVITGAVLKVYPVQTADNTVVPLTIDRLTSSWEPNALSWSNLPSVGTQVATQSRDWFTSPSDPFVFDVTTEIQAIVSGQDWYGWKLSSTGVNPEQSIWGGQSSTPMVIEITYTMPPPIPVDMWPMGNPIVYAAKPVLQWTVLGGKASTQIAFQVQVAADSAFTTSLYTSNEINSSAQMYDLSTAAPTFTALTNGQSRYWRVRVKNDYGVWSGYSAAAQFTYNTAPVTLITSPGSTTSDPTPEITWTFGTTMAAWQIQVDVIAGGNEDRAGMIYDSGIQYGTATSMMLPQGVVRYDSPQQYRIRLRVWASGTEIVSTAGRPTYFEDTQDFTWVPSGAAAPVQLQVTQVSPPMPWWNVRWEYTDATPALWFLVRVIRNGVIQDYWVSPASVREGATNWYNYTIYGVRARADVTFEVMTFVAFGTSLNNPTVTLAIRNLMPVVALQSNPANVRFSLLNADVNANLNELSDIVQPIVGDPILVNWSYGRLMGTVSGIISWEAPLDPGSFNAEDMFNDFLYMRTHPKVIMVWADQAIDAYIYDCTYDSIPRPDGKTDWLVSFNFIQVSP